MPLHGSILQAGTCKIFSLAENPRWSQVWQIEFNQTWPSFSWLNLTWHVNWLGSNTFGPKHLELSYFCDLRLNTKIKLPRLCRSWKKDGLRVGCGAYVLGGFMTITPRCGSILQAGPCQIFSLAENPRWSRVWQLELNQTWPNFSWLNLTWHDNWLGSNTFGPKHLELSYFCDFRLNTKIKLPRLCRSWKKDGLRVGCGAYVLGGWVVSWQ